MGIEVGDEQDQENSIQTIQKYYRGYFLIQFQSPRAYQQYAQRGAKLLGYEH
jgi:hypothetical protein